VYAWQVYEPDLDEWNIIAVRTTGTGDIPLITTRAVVADQLRVLAMTHGAIERKTVRLVRYDSMVVLETQEPT